MGRFKDKFMSIGKKVADKTNELMTLEEGSIDDDDFKDLDDDFKEKNEFSNDDYGVGIQQAQKPESFHHYLLANKYHDLELLIRGYKRVLNKTTEKWETKRKETHCFTDEEAENIVRMAESHLSPDIKLSYISKTIFPIKMLAIKEQLESYFYNIADYKYGRYGDSKKQFFMKQENLAIFVGLMERIQANYSMAIQGSENRNTHSAVKGQESLNNTQSDITDKGYY